MATLPLIPCESPWAASLKSRSSDSRGFYWLQSLSESHQQLGGLVCQHALEVFGCKDILQLWLGKDGELLGRSESFCRFRNFKSSQSFDCRFSNREAWMESRCPTMTSWCPTSSHSLTPWLSGRRPKSWRHSGGHATCCTRTGHRMQRQVGKMQEDAVRYGVWGWNRFK